MAPRGCLTISLGAMIAVMSMSPATSFSSVPPPVTGVRRRLAETRLSATEPSESSPSPLLRGMSRTDLFRGAMVAGSVAGAASIGVVSAQEEAQDLVVRRPELWEERIFDTTRRSYIPIRAERLVHHKVLNSPVICVGEIHTDVVHHMAELEILKAVHRKRGRSDGLAVGMEMFYRQHQDILDDYVFGSGTLASLKQDTNWDKTWGHKLFHYAKILQYAKTHGIRLVGLNVPIPVVQVVRRMGLEKMPSKLRHMLPEIDLTNEGHRDSFMSMMRMFAGAHGNMGEDALWRLYEAQTLWDEYMAESASNYIKERKQQQSMVVMAGSAHIENRYGVPDRISRRLGVPVFTVVPVTVNFDKVSGLPDIDQPFDREFADWIGVRKA